MTDFDTRAARTGLDITVLARDIQRLHETVVDGDPRWSPGDLQQLVMIGESLRLLLAVRNTLLVHLRGRRVSWKSISRVTGIGASTWRDRYAKANKTIGGTVAP